MKNGMKIVGLAVILACAGCRVPIPDAVKLSDARIGPKPSRAFAAATAQELLPGDAFAVGEVEPGFYALNAGARHQRFAWLLIARSPTRKPHHFYFLGDKLVATAFPSESWNGREYSGLYEINEMNGGGLPAYRAGLGSGGHRVTR